MREMRSGADGARVCGTSQSSVISLFQGKRQCGGEDQGWAGTRLFPKAHVGSLGARRKARGLLEAMVTVQRGAVLAWRGGGGGWEKWQFCIDFEDLQME